jgi:hypothetical protein
MKLGEIPWTKSGRAEPASKVTFSAEWMGTGAPTSTGGFSCGISTHMTAPACSATARINAATTVHLLGDLYTVADDTTRRGCGRFPAGGRDIRTTRACRATSRPFNVVLCILVFRREVDTSRQRDSTHCARFKYDFDSIKHITYHYVSRRARSDRLSDQNLRPPRAGSERW